MRRFRCCLVSFLILVLQTGPGRATRGDPRDAVKPARLASLVSNTVRTGLPETWWQGTRTKVRALLPTYDWSIQRTKIRIRVLEEGSAPPKIMVRDGQHRVAVLMRRLGPTATIADLPPGAIDVAPMAVNSSDAIGMRTAPPAYLTMGEFLERIWPTRR